LYFGKCRCVPVCQLLDTLDLGYDLDVFRREVRVYRVSRDVTSIPWVGV